MESVDRTRAAVWTAFGIAALAWLAPGAAAQTVIGVNVTFDGNDANPGDGICDCDPVQPGPQCSLRAAIEEACYAGGHVRIVLGGGVHVLSVIGTEHTSSRFGDLDVFGTALGLLEIEGVAGATIVDASGLTSGGGPERVLHVTSGTAAGLSVVLRDLVITGGRQSGSGGGIRQDAGSLTLVDTFVSSNSAHDGGGIWSSALLSVGGGGIDSNDTSLSPIGNGGGLYLAPGAQATLSGTTVIINGASHQGGGLYVASGASADLAGVGLASNQADVGGAIDNFGWLTLADCTLDSNTATAGVGGGVSHEGGTVDAVRTVFRSNVGSSGGGGMNLAGLTTASLRDCTFDRNHATGGPGGGVANSGTLDLESCALTRNDTGGLGGGGLYSLGSLDLVNVTVSSNVVLGGSGGGLYLTGPAPKGTSACTIAENFAAASGGGVYSDAPWSLVGTLIASNQTANGAQNFAGSTAPASSGRNLDTDGTCGLPNACDVSGTLAAPIDARISPLGPHGGTTETHALLEDSPALHRGAGFDLAGNTLTEDQRGFPRAAAFDVGAFEGSPEIGSFCDATDGALAACPCSNPGLPDTGCDNAQGTGGVRIEVTDIACPLQQVTITATGHAPAGSPTAILIRASGFGHPVVFGDGILCLTGPVVRMAAATASGGTSVHVFNQSPALHGIHYYQLWYRSSPAGYCVPAAAFNLSNGQRIVWP